MYSIKENSFYSILVKNSKFICYLFKINDKEEFDSILSYIKNKYKDATHYCYGYVTLDYQKSSDDGEPGGTAGMPILNVLNSNHLINTGCIVIRYFGGIKLGSGGLVRAYSKCVSEAIKENSLVELTCGYDISLSFGYDKSKEMDYIFKDSLITFKEFSDMINYRVEVSSDILNTLDNMGINYVINKKIYIIKK